MLQRVLVFNCTLRHWHLNPPGRLMHLCEQVPGTRHSSMSEKLRIQRDICTVFIKRHISKNEDYGTFFEIKRLPLLHDQVNSIFQLKLELNFSLFFGENKCKNGGNCNLKGELRSRSLPFSRFEISFPFETLFQQQA